MCKFYSAVVTKNGDLYHNPFLTSHEDIIDLFNLHNADNKPFIDKLCRIEFYPDDDKYICDVDKYNLHVDEDIVPEWFEEYRELTISKLRDIINSMIIKEDSELIVGRGIILSNDITVRKLSNCVVYHCNNSRIENACNSRIVYAGSSTIKHADSSRIVNADNSTIVNAGNSTIINK